MAMTSPDAPTPPVRNWSESVVAYVPILESLDSVAGHEQIPELSRWIFPGVPLVVSVHEIKGASPMRRHYCDEHSHGDEDEVLIALGVSDDFTLDLVIGSRRHQIGPKSAAFVPAGTTHSTNVVVGTGFLVTLKSARRQGVSE